MKVLRLPSFKDIPHKNIRIGNNVSIGKGVIFEIPKGAELSISDRVTVGDYNRFSTLSKITISSDVALAENVSIRGSFHQFARSKPIIEQSSSTEEISLGTDVLIGAYSIVLQGAKIPDGVIIGARSLVRKQDQLDSYGIFAGTPLKLIRFRE